jgi:hypothetical protein
MSSPADFLAVLKEYGLAGVLAWLFWWTLRRTMNSHDATVSQLKGQLDAQAEGARSTSESFAKLVENHMTHVIGAVERFDVSLGHYTEDERRWQDRLLATLEAIAARVRGERSAA